MTDIPLDLLANQANILQHQKHCFRHSIETRCQLKDVPGASQSLVELLGNGASHRIFRRFIESSYVTLDPKENGK